MFAINHAATALIIKKRYPEVPMVWLLISVQFVEVLWVLLNFLGIERTSTEATIRSVSEIHLEYMPYSHSVASSLVFALVAWVLLRKLYKQRAIAVAVAIGVFSHIVLDVVTHAQDISVFPFVFSQKIGIGLYEIPMLGFFVELAYGVVCWWIFQGSKVLLVTIVAFNFANITFFSVALTGPEALMANHPMWIVAAVAAQIVVTLILIGVLARPINGVVHQQIAR